MGAWAMTRSPLWRSSVVALALGGALAAPPAWAQQSVSPCTRNVNGGCQAVTAAAPLPVTSTPSPSPLPSAGLAPVTSSSLEANHVIKASAGNLYSFEVSADSTLSSAAWWVMVYNATSAPGDGAVTPTKCFAQVSGTASASYAWPTPIYFAAGIVVGVSTTGCFTKTASAHALISGDAQ